MHLGTSYHLEQLKDDVVAEAEDPPDIVEISGTNSDGFWAASDPVDPSDGDAAQAAHRNISHKSHKSSLSIFLSAPCILQLLQRAKLVQNSPLSLCAAKNARSATRLKRKAA